MKQNNNVKKNSTKKQLTPLQQAKLNRYRAIKENVTKRFPGISTQQQYLAKLNSLKQKQGSTNAEFDALAEELRAEWMELQRTRAASKANGTAAKTVRKPKMSNEEQLAALQSKVEFKGKAKDIYKNIYRKNASESSSTVTTIMKMLMEGKNSNTIKSNIKAKIQTAAEKRKTTMESTKMNIAGKNVKLMTACELCAYEKLVKAGKAEPSEKVAERLNELRNSL